MRWGTDPDYAQGSASVSAYDTTEHLFASTMTGLTPGVKYYYEVSTGGQCASSSFLAPPPDTATTVSFLAYADTPTDIAVHDRVAGKIVSRSQSKPEFQTLVLHAGDWVRYATASSWMDERFNPNYSNIAQMDASLVETGVRGNHETNSIYFARYFPQPHQIGGFYRSFDYGPMHVVLLDQYIDYTVGSPQYEWLKDDLAASSKIWKFVVLHEPGWSAGTAHTNNTAVQNDLQPLFKQYGVSIVFGGHNHYYARAAVEGIQHLTVGVGGERSYPPDLSYPYLVAASQMYGFVQFTITGNTLSAQAVTDMDVVVDTFSITR